MPDVRSRGRAYGRATNEPKPRSDAYTGLLLLSLLAQVAGVVFLFLDWQSVPGFDAAEGEQRGGRAGRQSDAAGPAPVGPQPPVNPAPMNPMNPPPVNPGK